jgi:hypothetical protein
MMKSVMWDHKISGRTRMIRDEWNPLVVFNQLMFALHLFPVMTPGMMFALRHQIRAER